MLLDDFLTELFGNIADAKGVDNIKKVVKKNITVNYDTTNIEAQVLTDNDNFPGNLCVNSEAYPDGEIIFFDFNLDGIYEKK